MNIKRRMLCAYVMHKGGQRQLNSEGDCATIWPEGTGPMVPWPERFPPREHLSRPYDPQPSTPLAFAVYFTDCPENTGASDAGDGDTAGKFLDTAAVTKHGISCAIPSIGDGTDDDSTESASSTMYAIMHKNAVICTAPDGTDYDRVSLLQSLGYWVKIWDSPISENMANKQPYLKDNIEDDVGWKDFMKLQALNLYRHEFVVVIDEQFVLKKPLDDVLDDLRKSGDIAAFVTDPDTNVVSTKLLVLKVSKETYTNIFNTYRSVLYTETGGWGQSGIGTQPGGMGTGGLLDYYMSDPLGNNPNPHTGTELDRCKYANNADETCNTTPFQDIVGYTMTHEICGQPWKCAYHDQENTWSPETKLLCDVFLVHWIQSREEFEDNFNQETSDKSGDFHKEIYHGLCSQAGQTGYTPMLEEMAPALENCVDGSLEFHGCDPLSTSGANTPMGSGLKLEVSVSSPEQCEVFTAGPNNGGAVIPLAGTAEITGTANADTSMVFVIGRSAPYCGADSGAGCSSENYNIQYDDILGCEIAAILDLVLKIREERTVGAVGIVSLSNRRGELATVELPLTDINLFDQGKAMAIESAIRNNDCGTDINYAGAVEKVCEVIESSKTTDNAVVFISDGLPNVGGAPAAYCSNNAAFHTIALGGTANCAGGEDTSLSTIAGATQGSCQEVTNIADIRYILTSIGNIQFQSIQGSTVASESSVNFGCKDVTNFVNKVGIDCQNMSFFCGGEYASAKFQNALGQSGDSSCCVCGGGIYLDIGDLDQVADDTFVPDANSLQVTSFQDMAIMHPGVHTVCTTVIGAEAGVPAANVICKKILVCHNAADY